MPHLFGQPFALQSARKLSDWTIFDCQGGDYRMRVGPFPLALYLTVLVVCIAAAISPYGSYQNQRQPHGSEDSQNSQGVPNHATQTHSGIQIECDPNCAAQESEKHRGESAGMRFVRKTLDDPLAAFTAALAISTMLLALYTAIVARATKAAAEHIPKVERAYLVGGGGLSKDTASRGCFALNVANYGKTPAFMNGFTVHLCSKDDLKKPPKYLVEGFEKKDRMPFDDVFAQGTDKTIWTSKTRSESGSYVYGRFWYYDAWSPEEHWFSFVLAVYGDDTHSDVHEDDRLPEYVERT